MLEKIFIVLGGYLLGAVPFGVLIARFFYHIDIRRQGSCNTGATNVWRVLGKKPGLATLALDIMKGAAPVFIARHFLPDDSLTAILAGLTAIVGHNWSVFLMGSGGKGVATSAGVFLALLPVEMGIALLVFGVVFFATKYVSAGSLSAAVALTAATLVRPTSTALRVVVGAAAAMVIIKHIPNMRRLARGEEHQVNFK